MRLLAPISLTMGQATGPAETEADQQAAIDPGGATDTATAGSADKNQDSQEAVGHGSW